MPTNTHPRTIAAAVLLVSTATAFLAPATLCSVKHRPAALLRPPAAKPASGVRQLVIAYRASDGRTSHATVLLPRWYGSRRNPVVPLVISPHGRGLWGQTNARLWGDLPARGGFMVVNPDGEGSHLSGRFSWGAPGQIDDLARMPQILHNALPWLRIDPRRVYAVGGSMGGQETLLLLGRYPGLLAGAVAVDPLVDLARQYRNFATFSCSAVCRHNWGGPIGRRLQSFVRREVGGTPGTAMAAFAERNPLTYVRSIASSGVPLQIWWSRADKVIVDSRLHSGLLVKRIRELNPHARLTVCTGTWRHTHPLRFDRKLPAMLVGLGLLEQSDL